jgi:hypothetical protein
MGKWDTNRREAKRAESFITVKFFATIRMATGVPELKIAQAPVTILELLKILTSFLYAPFLYSA